MTQTNFTAKLAAMTTEGARAFLQATFPAVSDYTIKVILRMHRKVDNEPSY